MGLLQRQDRLFLIRGQLVDLLRCKSQHLLNQLLLLFVITTSSSTAAAWCWCLSRCWRAASVALDGSGYNENGCLL